VLESNESAEWYPPDTAQTSTQHSEAVEIAFGSNLTWFSLQPCLDFISSDLSFLWSSADLHRVYGRHIDGGALARNVSISRATVTPLVYIHAEVVDKNLQLPASQNPNFSPD